MIFFANRRNPDGIAIAQSPYRLDNWLQWVSYHFLNLMAWYSSAQKKCCGIFYRRAKRLHQCNHVCQTKNQLLYKPFLRQMILFYLGLRFLFRLIPLTIVACDRVATSWTNKVRLLSHIVLTMAITAMSNVQKMHESEKSTRLIKIWCFLTAKSGLLAALLIR